MNILKYFDEFVALAENDPEGFERKKRELLEEFFNTLPPEKQEIARRRQWRLEQELRKHKNGVDRYNAMVVEFWNGFMQFHKALNKEYAYTRNLWRPISPIP